MCKISLFMHGQGKNVHQNVLQWEHNLQQYLVQLKQATYEINISMIIICLLLTDTNKWTNLPSVTLSSTRRMCRTSKFAICLYSSYDIFRVGFFTFCCSPSSCWLGDGAMWPFSRISSTPAMYKKCFNLRLLHYWPVSRTKWTTEQTNPEPLVPQYQ